MEPTIERLLEDRLGKLEGRLLGKLQEFQLRDAGDRPSQPKGGPAPKDSTRSNGREEARASREKAEEEEAVHTPAAPKQRKPKASKKSTKGASSSAKYKAKVEEIQGTCVRESERASDAVRRIPTERALTWFDDPSTQSTRPRH